MEKIFGLWIQPNDDDRIVYYWYNVLNNRFRFHHWSNTTETREYDPNHPRFKENTKFKLTLIY